MKGKLCYIIESKGLDARKKHTEVPCKHRIWPGQGRKRDEDELKKKKKMGGSGWDQRSEDEMVQTGSIKVM